MPVVAKDKLGVKSARSDKIIKIFFIFLVLLGGIIVL